MCSWQSLNSALLVFSLPHSEHVSTPASRWTEATASFSQFGRLHPQTGASSFGRAMLTLPSFPVLDNDAVLGLDHLGQSTGLKSSAVIHLLLSPLCAVRLGVPLLEAGLDLLDPVCEPVRSGEESLHLGLLHQPHLRLVRPLRCIHQWYTYPFSSRWFATWIGTRYLCISTKVKLVPAPMVTSSSV